MKSKHGLEGLFKGMVFYFGIGCAAMPQTAQPDAKPRRSTTRANRALISFPDQIPGAWSVDKYLVPGARFCIGHLRNEHWLKGMSEEDKRKIREVQRDNYSILLYLSEHNGLRVVYNEGLDSKAWADISIGMARFSDEMLRVLIEDYQGEIKDLEDKLKDDDNEYLRKTIEENKKRVSALKQISEESIVTGAARKLAAEGKLKILPAETYNYKKEKMHDQLKSGEKSFKDADAMEIMLDDREDMFLEIASSQRHAFIFVVYGGAHAWGGKSSCGSDYPEERRLSRRDNIAEWNAKHPDKMFSLIEITPDSYEEIKANFVNSN